MAITPESLPQPPRRVHGKLGGSLWFTRIFIMPHMLIGIGALGYLAFLLLWLALGTDIPAVVTGRDISHSSKGGTRYHLKYQFQVDGQTKSVRTSVSYDLYELYQFHNQSNPPVTVHYFAIGPLQHSALRESGSLWSELGFLSLWAGFWNTVMSVFLYQIWIKPLRGRYLYRYGQAASGTVLNKRKRTGKSTTYYVSYSFQDPYSGREFEREMQVWKADAWHQAAIQQKVTVLYSQNNPKWSTVYEFGGYEVIDHLFS